MKTENFAPRVFWGWNGKITEQEAINQLKDFKDKGISGVFVHARAGLLTEYMGEEWMNAFEKTVEFCEKADLEVWIYDEYGWPSGFGGGKVYEKSEQFKEKYLEGKRCRKSELGEDADKVYAAYSFNNGGYVRVEKEESDKEYYFAIKRVNDYYVDVTDKDAIDYFIEVTHEEYKKRFSAHFGKTIKGVFTDEPHVPPQGMPLGKYIKEEFFALNGYPLEEAVPYVLFDEGDYRKKRYDYWKTISKLFTENYVKKYDDWCEKNGLIMTGHFACEEGLVDQIPVCGGVMPLYEKEGMIGIDALGNRFIPPLAYKQAESVAFQTGKRKILCETYAGSGYDCTFKELAGIWANQAAFGVNVPCLSISMYSLVGNRKRDYPQFFSYQMPFWDKSKVLFDEMASVNSRLYEGERTAPILVVHPKTSAWEESGYGERSRIMAISAGLRNLTESLIDLQADFDFGDEQFMQNHGIVNGKILSVGKCDYSAVIVPEISQIDKATLCIIKEFYKNGGVVISLNPAPVAVDCGKSGYENIPGIYSTNRKDYLRKVLAVTGVDTGDCFLESDGRRASSGLVVARRKHKGYTDIFALNKSRGDTVKTTLCTSGNNKITATFFGGKERVLFSEYDCVNDKTYTETELLPLQFAFYKAEKIQNGAVGAERYVTEEKVYIDDCFGKTEYTGRYAMDKASYSINGGEFTKEKYVLFADSDFYREINGGKKETLLRVRYTFRADAVPKKLYLGAETAGGKAFVNGNAVAPCGYFIDKGIDKFDISCFAVKGENEVIIEKTIQPFYNPLFDKEVFQSVTNISSFPYCMESAYLTGDFSVSAGMLVKSKNCFFAQDFAITEKRNVTGLSDLTAKGMPFFSGNLCSSAKFDFSAKAGERVYLGIDNLEAVVAEAELNGKKFVVAADYDKTDITKYLIRGENTLKLTLYSGLRNLFGPHHHVYGKHYYTGPSVFEGFKEWQDTVVYPELPQKTYTEKYSFVPFGAKGIYIERQAKK